MNSTVIKAKDIKRVWHLIDLKGQTLGRVSTDIAKKLMGYRLSIQIWSREMDWAFNQTSS